MMVGPLLLLLPLLIRGALADSPTGTSDATKATTTEHVPACTASSSSVSGAFFDLRPEMAVAPLDAGAKGSDTGSAQQPPPPSAGHPTADYKARGWDYGMNFTMNLCGAVVEPVRDVVGVDSSLWLNVSAYYTTKDGDKISIGQQSMDLVNRGRKLVLKYADGSPCEEEDSLDPKATPKTSEKGADFSRDPATIQYSDLSDEEGTGRTLEDTIDPDILRNPFRGRSGASSTPSSSASATRRKSTLVSFHCDRDPSLKQAAISFVGTPDNCAYFFEVRSQHACARAEPDKPGSVGPGGVFGLILGITIIVYLLGGVFYNRTVAHARGWRQLPNYSLWAGIWNSISDLVVSLLASCSRYLPNRHGYRHLSSSPRTARDREDENRLIDQLDEEWDD